MCNGESSRKSLGGTIAILKSAPSLSEKEVLSLSLEDDRHTGRTIATISGSDAWDGARHFVIHRDGDLRLAPADESTVLHRFAIPAQSGPDRAFLLNAKLDLGVGGQGIIGRRVSLLYGHVVAAEGIMGWN